jgi:nucleoid-associated protein YgaU
LVVTAFAAVSLLPFAGCSSQQQQATDEVAAEGQEGATQEGGGEETAATEQGGGEETAATEQGGGEETAATEQGATNPASDPAAGSENLAGNPEGATSDPGTNGDVQNIISEMSGAQGAQAATEAAADPAATAVAETTPPDPSAVNGANAPVAPVAEAQAVPATVPATAAGLPEMGSKMAYVVEAGDTLAKIATKIYGDQKRWRDIAGLSGMDNPNHIFPGDLVYYTLDEQSQNFAQNHDTLKRGQETVREGDTLAAISKRVYGSSKLWKHIWRQNDHIDNPDKLTAGMTVFYMEKSGIKTAQTKVKSIENSAKNQTKIKNFVTFAKTGVAKKALAVIAASV